MVISPGWQREREYGRIFAGRPAPAGPAGGTGVSPEPRFCRSSLKVDSRSRTTHQPTRIISMAGACRCGRVVPVHSSTTIGLKSRNIASFEVAATH